MQRTVVVGNDKNNPWFDHECRVKRRLLRQTLRKYNKAFNTVETADLRKKYSEQRKKYKNTLKEKKSEHKKLILKTRRQCNGFLKILEHYPISHL